MNYILWTPSPNYDINRKPIDRIVIHWMNGTLLGTDAVFKKPNGTSAHYGIENNLIHQYVKEGHVAYHAGNYEMNQRSIGIEHSADPNREASEQTYQTSAALISEICARYSIPIDREHIIKHSEVPRATQCPGTINIDRLIELARRQGMEPTVEQLKNDIKEKNIHISNLEKQVQGLLEKKNLNNDSPLDVDMDIWTINGMQISRVDSSGRTITLNYKLK